MLLCAIAFGAACPAAGAPAGDPPPDYSAARLVGTIEGDGFSGAVFEDNKEGQAFYPAGATFSDGSRIVAVRPEGITVRTAEGALMELLINGGKPGRPGPAQAARPGAGDGPANGWGSPSPDPSMQDGRAGAAARKQEHLQKTEGAKGRRGPDRAKRTSRDPGAHEAGASSPEVPEAKSPGQDTNPVIPSRQPEGK